MKKVIAKKVSKMAAYEKKDKAMDKKAGVKEGSKADIELDTKAMHDSTDKKFIKGMKGHLKEALKK